MTRITDGMTRTWTTAPATVERRSDRPGTGRTPQPPRRDRTPPRDTAPQWHTEPPAAGRCGPRAAERLLRLRTSTLHPHAYAPLLHAARVLLHTGHPHRTAVWCAKLHEQSRTAKAPAWSAAFRALRAEALLQLGDLTAAAHEAAAAHHATGTQDTPLRRWPTAVLAEALIAQGRYEEAAEHLEQPTDPTWQSLPWLRARGRLHLAAHRHHDALAVFRTTGRLIRRHGPGGLPHVPWRTDTAEALLRLGHVDQARGLLAGELAAARTSGPRQQGIALRLLAATEEPGMRPGTLARALTELRRCKDRLELVHALDDLGHTLATLGDPSSADVFLRRAAHLATDCGTTPPRLRTPPPRTARPQ
ncbi:tetratricopeptide repeat protein [Streptomyces sp. NPDC057474]|uniref:tetratricopeptide repeat protein n=1 Tax=Streptomyces sp. NPDC057474 TaxID=3346144 RepID=UPI00368A3E85